MKPSWHEPPRVVGHRGSPLEAPENTIASFRAALRAGARAVELDVRLTRDLVPVVLHDPELGRTVDGRGLVERLTYEELSRMDAGAWFSREFAGERVPKLAQVFQDLPPDLLVNVELKADADNARELPQAALRALAEAGAVDRCLVTSFDPELADEYARLSGRPAGLILPFAPEEHDLDAWPRLRYLALAWDAATEETIQLARRKGRTVLVWTVNRPRQGEELLRKGAASIITDRPGDLVRSLGDAPAP